MKRIILPIIIIAAAAFGLVYADSKTDDGLIEEPFEVGHGSNSSNVSKRWHGWEMRHSDSPERREIFFPSKCNKIVPC